MIAAPWPSCHREVHHADKHYAEQFDRSFGYYSGDIAIWNKGDHTFRLLGRKDNIIVFSLQYFMTHREQIEELCEEYAEDELNDFKAHVESSEQQRRATKAEFVANKEFAAVNVICSSSQILSANRDVKLL